MPAPTQLDLFSASDAAVAAEVRKMARHEDPESSYVAAEGLVRRGALGGLQQDALECVKRWPGNTSKNLAELARVDRHALAKRLPELESKGWIRREERGREELRWWPKGDDDE